MSVPLREVPVKQSVLPDAILLTKEISRTVDKSTVAQMDLRRVERTAANAARSREELRIAIALAREAGETLEDIGRAAGLSRQRIAQILRGTR